MYSVYQAMYAAWWGWLAECAKGMTIPRAALPCIERAHVSLMQPDKYLSIT